MIATRKRLTTLSWFFCIVTAAAWSETGQSSGERPALYAGQVTTFQVDLYPQHWLAEKAEAHPRPIMEKDRKPMAKYLVAVRVEAQEKVDGETCWRVIFWTDKTAPPGLANVRYDAWLSQQDMQVRKLEQIGGPTGGGSRSVIHLDGLGVIDEPIGFPIVIVPDRPGADADAGIRRERQRTPEWADIALTLRKATETKKGVQRRTLIEERQGPDGPWRAEHVWEQTWEPNAPWWRTYTKRTHGFRELVATRLDDDQPPK